MPTGCINEEFYKYQSSHLQHCLDEHKWYMSEKAHYDVGREVAEADFFSMYFQGFAAGFRAAYCGLVCKHGGDCVIGCRYKVG